MVPMVHVSRYPKVHPSNVDLFYPEGHGVNSGIAENLCSLSYVSMEEAARTVVRLGRGTLSKVDIRNAYRKIPV